MKTLKATTQLGGFNQHLLMIKSNNNFTYSGPHQHEYDSITTLLSSLQDHNDTTSVEIIFGTKTLLTDVWAIWYKPGLNISKVFQDRFHERGISINIWSENAQ